MRYCMGVFVCEVCGGLARPKTKAYKGQLDAGCRCGGPFIHRKCQAKTWRFVTERDGVKYSTWVHAGSHSSHPRPPGGRTAQRQAVTKPMTEHANGLRHPGSLKPSNPSLTASPKAFVPPAHVPSTPPPTSTQISLQSISPQPPLVAPRELEQKELISYQWSGGNSCFFDVGLALWFEGFKRWDSQHRDTFLTSLNADTVLLPIFNHFERRIKWLEGDEGGIAEGRRELMLGQQEARRAIFDRMNLYESAGAYGCSRTWLMLAVAVSVCSNEVER